MVYNFIYKLPYCLRKSVNLTQNFIITVIFTYVPIIGLINCNLINTAIVSWPVICLRLDFEKEDC